MGGAAAIVSLDDFLAELGPAVAGTVVVVLPRDPGQHLLHLVLVDAVLLGVGGGEQAEPGRGGGLGQRPVGGDRVAR